MKEHNLKLDDFDLDEIESIELIGEDDTIDIQVEDTHMFYANDIYTHNSSLNAGVVDGVMMGGSIKKGQIGHFIVSIAKTLDQKEDRTATMAIIKSRFASDGMVFQDIKFDNARIQIDMNPAKGAQTQSEYKRSISRDETLHIKGLLETTQARKKLLAAQPISPEDTTLL